MRQEIFKITSNENIAPSVYKMVLAGDTSDITAPGQFVNIKLEGFYLRRPISICDYDGDSLTLIYKTVGGGTENLSLKKSGDELDLLISLGNGFDTRGSGEKPLIIGGGVGIPPLYALCKKLISEGKKPAVILGFNTKSEIFYENEFKNLGCEVFVTTADGSHGIKGFVTAAMDKVGYTYIYSCGPLPMFKAVNTNAKTSGQFSFEERMGCGFGACMGCSLMTRNGAKRVCKDGPVFEREEIEWEALK